MNDTPEPPTHAPSVRLFIPPPRRSVVLWSFSLQPRCIEPLHPPVWSDPWCISRPGHLFVTRSVWWEEEKTVQKEWDSKGWQCLLVVMPHESDVANSLARVKVEERYRQFLAEEEEKHQQFLASLKFDLQNIPDERLAQYNDGPNMIAMKHEAVQNVVR